MLSLFKFDVVEVYLLLKINQLKVYILPLMSVLEFFYLTVNICGCSVNIVQWWSNLFSEFDTVHAQVWSHVNEVREACQTFGNQLNSVGVSHDNLHSGD